MDCSSMQNMVRAFPDKAQNPFKRDYNFYLHIEVEAFDEANDDASQRLLDFFERIGDSLRDGVVASDQKQFDQLWFLRKGIITSATQVGHLYHVNLAVPNIREYYSVVEAIRETIETSSEFTVEEKEIIVPLGYGHMADGDIQISTAVIGGEEVLPTVSKAAKVLDPFIVDFIASKRGSITGEHGVGL